MAYYNVCSNCGNNLDPGEKCDCEIEKVRESNVKTYISNLKRESNSGQLAFVINNSESGCI